MITKADISFVRSLADRKGRDAHGLFVAEGRKLVGEAVSSGLEVRRIFATGEFSDFSRAEIISPRDFERISNMRTPQGIMALVGIPHYGLPVPSASELIMALDGVQDPGNLGAIIRIADWFGVNDIVCSRNTVDCFKPKVVQATMGAVLRVMVHYTDLLEMLSTACGSGIPVYGAFLEGENIYSASLESPAGGILLFGSEGGGISREAAGMVTRKLFISPFPEGRPSSESLNVASAAAVLCSEFRRRERNK